LFKIKLYSSKDLTLHVHYFLFVIIERKKHTMRYIFLFISFVAITSCKNVPESEKTQTQLMHEEVMRIHDDVMPKTADIHRVIKRLKKEKKTITENNGALLQMFDSIIKDLNDADELMGEWMANYKKPDFKDLSDETLIRLNDEKVKISNVRNEMLSALNKGTKFYEHIHSNNPANDK